MAEVGPPALEDREGASTYRAPRANLSLRDFDILGRLGDGSFSTAILARLRHEVPQQGTPWEGGLVAIKMVNKHLVMRNKMTEYCRNERTILDRLQHEGVIKLLFTFQDPDSLYFGLEYCPGGDLYEQITQKGQLSLEDTRFYAAEVIQVLEYLRTQQVVHRDLKPENLLITKEGHLKLTDFGSAKAFFLPPAVGPSGKAGRATSFVGTAEYVSPEVLNNTPLSYPADLWALGSLVYQMLTGQPPFKAGSEYLSFQKVSEREFEFPESFPPLAVDLINRLLVLEPEQRLGADDLGALRAHPFFEGINWETLRQQQAPKYIPPTAPTPEAEGLDWELTSLVRDTMGGMVMPGSVPLPGITSGTGQPHIAQIAEARESVFDLRDAQEAGSVQGGARAAERGAGPDPAKSASMGGYAMLCVGGYAGRDPPGPGMAGAETFGEEVVYDRTGPDDDADSSASDD